jgi:Sec7-like guanine-nucleotide exchange factor
MRFLQQQGLVGNTPAAVATFLRESTFLDKIKIGDYLGGQYARAHPPAHAMP